MRNTIPPATVRCPASQVSGLAAAVLTVLCWAGLVIMARLGGHGGLNAYDMVALRLGPAAVVTVPVFLLRRPRLDVSRMLALAATGGVGYAVVAYWGFILAPAVHAGIFFNGMLPVASSAFAWLVLGQRPKRRSVASMALSLVGLAFVAGQGLLRHDAGSGSFWAGDLLFVVAALCWACYGVLMRRWQVEPLDAIVVVASVSALLYLPVYAALLPKDLHAAPWKLLATQGIYHGVVATLIAGLLFNFAVRTVGPVKTALLLTLVPCLTALAAVPLLHEPLTAGTVAGLATVSLAALLGAASNPQVGRDRRMSMSDGGPIARSRPGRDESRHRLRAAVPRADGLGCAEGP